MRKTLVTLALATALLVAPGLTPAAHAGGYGWLSIGSGFRIGGLSLSLVFGRPFGYDNYYYRFPQPIAYRGVHCTSRCFVDRGVYYHDRNCPVVNAYFRSYRVDPYQVYSRYAPRNDGYEAGYYGGYDNGAYDNGDYDQGYYDQGYYGQGYYYGGGAYYSGPRYYGGGVTYYNRGYSRDRHYDRSYGRDRHSDRNHYDRRDDGRHDHMDHGHDHGGRGQDHGGHGDGGHGTGGHGNGGHRGHH